MTFGFDERLPNSAIAFPAMGEQAHSLRDRSAKRERHLRRAIRKQLQGWPGFDYRNWQSAAQFCADNKINLEEALVWADKAIKEPFRGAER